jgi:hypothetical protein
MRPQPFSSRARASSSSRECASRADRVARRLTRDERFSSTREREGARGVDVDAGGEIRRIGDSDWRRIALDRRA